jgi:deoxyribonuclease-4
MELTAGGAGSVASTFRHAREVLTAVDDHPRIVLCADTCHLFQAGYALDSPDGVAAAFAELRSLGLARRLRIVHANDSTFPRGSRRDSHTHIGEGYIGEVGFASILAQPAVRRCAVLCETPGRLEDHARNIATLRRLAADPPPRAAPSTSSRSPSTSGRSPSTSGRSPSNSTSTS